MDVLCRERPLRKGIRIKFVAEAASGLLISITIYVCINVCLSPGHSYLFGIIGRGRNIVLENATTV